MYKLKYLKYKKKYLNLKIFKFGGSNMNQTDFINNMNQTSLQKAKDLNYETNEDLHLIIGTSNDNRFDEFQGFTVNNRIEIGEEYNLNKNNIFPLFYNVTSTHFFDAINQFNFRKIIFDYNVLEFLSETPQFEMKIQKLANKLRTNGELYLPINIKRQLQIAYSYEDAIKEELEIEFDNTNRTFIETNPKFFTKNYRIIGIDDKKRYFFKNETDYLENSLKWVQNNFNPQEYDIQFFINSHAYDEQSYKEKNESDNVLQFSPYPIQSRISEFKFSGSICEFAVITKIN